MNKVILMGRITHDLQPKQAQTGKTVLNFSLAVDRYAGKGQEKQTDFIRCTAFGANADNIARYFGKGRLILIEGSIKTGKFTDKNGVNRDTFDIWIDRFDFTGDKSPQNDPNVPQNGYMPNGGNNYGDYQNTPQNASQPPYNTWDYEEVFNNNGDLPF